MSTMEDQVQPDVTPVKPEDVPPPPSYEEVMGMFVTSVQNRQTELPSLAYIDVMPRLLYAGNIVAQLPPMFQTFEEIVNGANVWLRDHPDLSVWKCETVERKVNSVSSTGQVSVDLDSMSHSESVFGFNCFVQGLRLWLTKNTQKTVQELGMMNVLPNATEVEVQAHHYYGRRRRMGVAYTSTMTMTRYEGVRKTLESFNAKVKDEPIPGTILNIESTYLKFAESGQQLSLEAAAIASSRHERDALAAKRYTQILRLYYVKGSPSRPQIKMAEFQPYQENAQGVYLNMRFSKFDTVLEQVACWIQQQKALQIVNIETKEAKIDRPFSTGKAEIDSDSSDYFMFGRFSEPRLRYIRVFYIDISASGSFAHTRMTSRLFTPMQIGPSRFESMTKTMDRIDAWLKVIGLPIFGVETVQYTKESIGGSAANSSTYNLKLFSAKTWVTAIRVYFPSAFEEPDPKLLPPPPSNKSSSCSIL